jgi:hypothetical protein
MPFVFVGGCPWSVRQLIGHTWGQYSSGFSIEINWKP